MDQLEDIRKTAETFVRERDWEQFHSPCNILLALCGEVGEIAECFQWKGDLDSGVTVRVLGDGNTSQGSFKPEEVVHVGEEIADVLIYLSRLSDVMRVDLGAAVTNLIQASQGSIGAHSSTRLSEHMEEGSGWSPCALEDLHAYAAEKRVQRSPRHFALQIVNAAGKLTSLFSARPEGECSMPWQQWVAEDMAAAIAAITEIAVLCTALANTMSLDAGQVRALHAVRASFSRMPGKCPLTPRRPPSNLPPLAFPFAQLVARKFHRNAAKYPAAAVRGSSAKYNTYAAAGKGTGTAGEESDGTRTLFLVVGTVSARDACRVLSPEPVAPNL